MPSADLAAARLVRVGRLVGAGADAVADRVATAGRGSRSRRCPSRTRRSSSARLAPGAAEGDRVVVDGDEPLPPAPRSAACQLAADEVLRVVGPVAVGADPDLEQRRLALDDRPVGGRRERLDPRARPDSEKPSASSTLPLPAGALAVDEALPGGCRPAPRSCPARISPRTCSIAAAAISFASRIRSTSCARLDRARRAEQRRRVDRVRETRRTRPSVKVVGSPTMRSVACVPSDSSRPTVLVLPRAPRGELERPQRPAAAGRPGRSRGKRRTSFVHAVRAASSSDGLEQNSDGSPSRGKTTAS